MTVWYEERRASVNKGGAGWSAKYHKDGKQHWVKGGPWHTREEAEAAEAKHRERMDVIAREERQRIREARPHAVYMLFAEDVLLYVGITCTGMKRMEQHRVIKGFWPQVTRAEFEHYPNRAEAHTRERELVAELQPPYNVHYTEKAKHLADHLNAVA